MAVGEGLRMRGAGALRDRPPGHEEFVKELERKWGRELAPRRPGFRKDWKRRERR